MVTSSQVIRMHLFSSRVSLSLQSSHSDPSPSLECPPNPKPGTPHPSRLTASEIGEKGTTEGGRVRMSPLLGLEEGGALPYLRARLKGLVVYGGEVIRPKEIAVIKFSKGQE